MSGPKWRVIVDRKTGKTYGCGVHLVSFLLGAWTVVVLVIIAMTGGFR